MTSAISMASSNQTPEVTHFVPLDVNVKCIRRYFNNVTNTYYFYNGYSGIPENFTLAVILWVILMIIFILVRRFTLGRPRATGPEAEAVGDSCWGRLFYYFGWVGTLLRLREPQISGKCGPDALIYLVFQKYLIVYLIVVCFVSTGVVLPVNYHGNLVMDTAAFGKTTIANIDANSPLLWLHAVVSLVYLVLALVFMHRFKNTYLASRKEELKTRTLIFTNLPPSANTDKALIEFFREKFQETFIETFNHAYNVKYLTKIYDERQRNHDLRRLAEEKFTESSRRELMYRHSCACCCTPCGCQQEDALEYYTDEESRLSAAYHDYLVTVLANPLDIAFVTFTSETMAKRVLSFLTSPLGHRGFRFRCACCPWHKDVDIRRCGVQYAPEPEDIFWENLSQSRVLWWIKAILINVILCIVLFLITTPSVVMSLLDEWRYKEALGQLQSPALLNVAPVLLLWIFSALLPAAVYLSEHFVGHWTRSKEQKVIMIKTFVFRLLMILVLPSLGLTSAKALLQWLIDQDTGTRVRWACIFLPDNGAFFVNYIITSCFIGSATKLLRIFDLLRLGVRLCLARSSAEITMAWRSLTSDCFRYGVEYAWTLVIFCSIVSYSVSVPLIAPIGLVYFLFRHMVDKHNIYYAYKPTRMSSEPHHRAVHFVYTAAIFLQINNIAFTMLRAEGYPPPPAIFSIVVLVVALLYLTGSAIAVWVRNAMAVFTEVKDTEIGLSSADQYIYIPEVILWGANGDNLRRIVAPRANADDL